MPINSVTPSLKSTYTWYSFSHFSILFYFYSFTLNLNLMLFFYLSIIYDNQKITIYIYIYICLYVCMYCKNRIKPFLKSFMLCSVFRYLLSHILREYCWNFKEIYLLSYLKWGASPSIINELSERLCRTWLAGRIQNVSCAKSGCRGNNLSLGEIRKVTVDTESVGS